MAGVDRVKRPAAALVAGILLVLVSAGACDGGTTGPGTEQPAPGGTVQPTDGDGDDGPDDGEGPDDAPSGDPADDDGDEDGDDAGVPGGGDGSDD